LLSGSAANNMLVFATLKLTARLWEVTLKPLESFGSSISTVK
jgi:hypothetical protein